ncbi:MAG TPA: GNAT family N-acetyltransferase [Microscillaceae bacterium]|nr:GNAT family N-acetyltransferase [Microscillaceae bacterium]
MTNTTVVYVANESHLRYAEAVCLMIEEAAKVRGTGIAKRDPEYIKTKMREGKAVIALKGEALAGFCYIETWQHGNYVAHSGLIVNPDFRGEGLAKTIKAKAFELSKEKFPNSKVFGLTTSLPVMKINSELGYKPVTFSELTQDETFWKGCQSCINYDILTRTNRKHCLCTGMMYDPTKEAQKEDNTQQPPKKWKHSFKVYQRWMRYKQFVLTQLEDRKEKRMLKKNEKLDKKAQKIEAKLGKKLDKIQEKKTKLNPSKDEPK